MNTVWRECLVAIMFDEVDLIVEIFGRKFLTNQQKLSISSIKIFPLSEFVSYGISSISYYIIGHSNIIVVQSCIL